MAQQREYKETCKYNEIGVNIGTFKNQISRNIIPDVGELYILSILLKTSMETFITGEDTDGEAKYKKLKTEMLDLLQKN